MKLEVRVVDTLLGQLARTQLLLKCFVVVQAVADHDVPRWDTTSGVLPDAQHLWVALLQFFQARQHSTDRYAVEVPPCRKGDCYVV